MNFKMKQHVAGAASVITMLLSANVVTAEDMGLMHVDSTTIDDRFESKRGEPSNISMISGDKVEKAHTENIQQVLNAIPGVTFSRARNLFYCVNENLKLTPKLLWEVG